MRAGFGTVVLAGAVVLAVGLGAAPPVSAAAKTWTVSPGGAIKANAGKTTLTDTTTGSSLNCTSSKMSGTLNKGSGLPGTGIGSITTAAYDCGSPLPWFHLTSRGLPWHLNFTSYNARTGVTHGTISHVQLALSGPACSAAINGTSSAASNGVVAVSYTNATGKLKVLSTGGNLHWYHVHGCAGLVGNGDPAQLSAAYAVSPRQTVTSP
jgi:hypothetical protein